MLVFYTSPNPEIGFGTDIGKKVASDNGLCDPPNSPEPSEPEVELSELSPVTPLSSYQEHGSEKVAEGLEAAADQDPERELAETEESGAAAESGASKLESELIGVPSKVREAQRRQRWAQPADPSHGVQFIPTEDNKETMEREAAERARKQAAAEQARQEAVERARQAAQAARAAAASPSDGNGKEKGKIPPPPGQQPTTIQQGQRAQLLEEIHRDKKGTLKSSPGPKPTQSDVLAELRGDKKGTLKSTAAKLKTQLDEKRQELEEIPEPLHNAPGAVLFPNPRKAALEKEIANLERQLGKLSAGGGRRKKSRRKPRKTKPRKRSTKRKSRKPRKYRKPIKTIKRKSNRVKTRRKRR